AAGSFTNIVTALVALMLIIFVMAPFANSMTDPTGMSVVNVINDTPAYGVLEQGYIITEINGMQTLDIESFYTATGDLKSGQTISIVTTNGTFDMVLDTHPTNPDRGYIGIDLKETFELKEQFRNEQSVYVSVVMFVTPTLFWIFFICFNVALVNLLPILPFDGGKMFEEYMEEFKIKKKKRELMQKGVIFVILLLLLVNASPLVGMLFT
ncbi:MAG: site-2 protease family protein, partial [Candidatus Aenigmarchaeota archaeon]|nr:site-2 protease family protein [Candidatus Aenigmarchaeota archaeon]